jgi:hypothetical protein
MSLADTGKAIGKVTALLVQHLDVRLGANLPVTVGKPEPPQGGQTLPEPRVNLFLYEALFDPGMKNISLDEGQPPPLWLVLKYLITAFDDSGGSDTAKALEHLGEGIRALQELNYLSLTAVALPPGSGILPALEDNPEPLKITFDEVSSELLSKLMQGTDEKYRFSMGFQVRPVLIAPEQPTAYSLLIGVDYTAPPAARLIGEDGIDLSVLPSIQGPFIEALSPSSFEADEVLKLSGENLNLTGLSVELGPVLLIPTAQQFDNLEFTVNGNISGGGQISAGSHPIAVVQTLPSGRRRSSGMLVANLRPRVDTVTAVGQVTTTTLPDGNDVIAATIKVAGVLLGTGQDDVFLALYKSPQVIKVFDDLTFAMDQKSAELQIVDTHEVPPDTYRVILRVNGQQATFSPEIDLS